MLATNIILVISIPLRLVVYPAGLAYAPLHFLVIILFPLGIVWATILSLVWVPFGIVLIASAVAWHRAPTVIKPLIASPVIPVALIGWAFITITLITPDPAERLMKLAMCMNWPFAMRTERGEELFKRLLIEEGPGFWSMSRAVGRYQVIALGPGAYTG